MSDSSGSGEEDPEQRPAVLCDMCAEDARGAALKTCVKCEISMCARHLQPHLTTPVLLLTHPLTEPTSLGAEGLGGVTRCSEHGKLIEYYCLDDLTSVCVSCAIEDRHRQHNMKTLPKAHAELVLKLSDWERAVAAKRPASGTLAKWEESEGGELSRAGVRLVETVSKLRDVALSRVRSSVSARTASIAAGLSSTQAAMGEKDTFRFLQLYSQAHRDVERAKAVDLRTGLEPGEERDKLAQELQDLGADMVAQATELWGSTVMFADPENHKELSRDATTTFAPLAPLGPGMSLSEDHRKVFHSRGPGAMPPQILMIKRADASSVHTWAVSVSENCDWTIGLCDKVPLFTLNGQMNGFVYALCVRGDDLSYLDGDDIDSTMGTPINPGAGHGARPKTVEVSWNPTAFTLSFFTGGSLHLQRRLIVSKFVSHISPPLTPFVQLQSKAGGLQGPGQTLNKMSIYIQANLGPAPITDVLCELL